MNVTCFFEGYIHSAAFYTGKDDLHMVRVMHMANIRYIGKEV
jgi:hypothetical protein